jgi:OHCU decarboxylase
MIRLDEVNASSADAFRALLGDVFEHSPWVAERSFAQRPFASVGALHAALVATLRAAPRAEQLALIRAHPELAGREARAGELTPASSGEQARLGFHALERGELERMAELNRRYREKFGFPCIIALARHASRAGVQAEFERRIENDMEAEVAQALEQISHIARARLERMIAQ